MTASITPLHPHPGGSALMVQVDRKLPGWTSVQSQAVDCGMIATPDDRLHVTLNFLGRDLPGHRARQALDTFHDATDELKLVWRAYQEDRGLDVRPAFVELLFSGEIGQFRNKTATHVIAVLSPTVTLVGFRDRFHALLPFTPRQNPGAWSPHLTLAEGPAGSALKRSAAVPECRTHATTLILKLGPERHMLRLDQ